MSLSILPYKGSKRMDIKYFVDYLPINITHIVEPFGGSGYLSLYLFSLNNSLKCIINDIDDELINFFNQIKKHPDEVIDGYNKIIISTFTKLQYGEMLKIYKSKNGTDLEKAILYLFLNKCHGGQKGMYPLTKNFKPLDINKYDIFFKWVQNTEFLLEDYSLILDKYKNNKSYFMFLDPPYFDSFNQFYLSYNKQITNKTIPDNTKLFIDIKIFLEKAKCKAMLIINKNAITEYIYKNFIVGEYDKLYQATKKRTVHYILTNYKINLIKKTID